MIDTNVFDVLAFGATSDGSAKSTVAIQSAIDACALAGGGRVLVPPGRYVSGTLFLKNHVELHVSAGAVLLASPDRADYNSDDLFPEDPPTPHEEASAAHFIIAYEQEDISITGLGTIDGNSAAFLLPLPESEAPTSYRAKKKNRPVNGWRPGKMMYFLRCQRLTLQDVSLTNSPYWTVTAADCADIRIRGLFISNPPDTRNGDGIDIVSCRNVVISDCIMRTGDDCIVVRTSNRLLPGDPTCENVVVTNCVLSTPCQGIRIGVADGLVRNCSFSNIVINDSNVGIDIVCRWSANVDHGTQIENLHFSDIVVDATIPITIRAGAGARQPAAIRDITFSRVRATVTAGSPLIGTPDVPLERIRFTDVDLHIDRGTDNTDLVGALSTELGETTGGRLNGTNNGPALPCALFATHLIDSTFENVRVHWGDHLGEVWQDGIVLHHANGTTLRNVVLRQPRRDAGTAVQFIGSEGLTVQGCRAAAGTSTFLSVANSPAAAGPLRVIGNDLLDASSAITSDVPIAAIGNLGVPAQLESA